MRSHAKIHSLPELAVICKDLKKRHKKIVLCHGCFDILHIGHVRHFKAAKRFGDILIVSLTADTHILKGDCRPVFNQELRMEFVASLIFPDYVVLSDSPSAVEVIESLKPHYMAKGSDYKSRDSHTNTNIYVEEQVLGANGGALIYTDDITYSSTDLVKIVYDRIHETDPVYFQPMSNTCDGIGDDEG